MLIWIIVSMLGTVGVIVLVKTKIKRTIIIAVLIGIIVMFGAFISYLVGLNDITPKVWIIQETVALTNLDSHYLAMYIAPNNKDITFIFNEDADIKRLATTRSSSNVFEEARSDAVLIVLSSRFRDQTSYWWALETPLTLYEFRIPTGTLKNITQHQPS